MSGSKTMVSIISIVFIVLAIIIIWIGLFSIWIFFGMLFLGALYIFGYFFVIAYFNSLKEKNQEENANRKKLDWCWNQVNKILRNMPGGQGIEWRKGIGRQSEVKTFYDGIQHRPFRSMMGYLAETQQLVVIIYDIDNDDIVRFHADPSPDIIQNHFNGFKPFSTQGSSFGGGGFDRFSNTRRGRRPRGVSIHVGDENDDNEDFDSLNSRYKPDEATIEDATKKLMEDNGRKN